MTYAAQCRCGIKMKTDADSKDDAIKHLINMMSPNALNVHMADRHPGSPIPSQEDVRQMIESTIRES